MNKQRIMKRTNLMLSLAVVAAMSVSSCKTEGSKDSTKEKVEVKTEIAYTDATFGVRGNCGMCKKTIEKAATSVEGVANANWDKAKKKIDVSFDGSKANIDAIHQAIANSGYDTDKLSGSEDAYNNLPKCCQYDHSMEMNLTEEVKEDNHSDH
jgi:periplasmic mercuric ion binding protein